MTQIPYPHTPVEVGPYEMKVRLCRSGEPFFERLTPQMIRVLEWLANYGGVSPSASIIRVDMVPMTEPNWGLSHLQGESISAHEKWRRKKSGTIPVFEVESGCPSIVIPFSFFRGVATLGNPEGFEAFRKGIAGRKFKLFQHRPEDASIYELLAGELEWKTWTSWEALAREFERGVKRVYASVPPDQLPHRDWFESHGIQLAGNPWLGKAPWTELFGGCNLGPDEIRAILNSWPSNSKSLPLLFQYAMNSGGFYLKPNLGACCEGSENQSSTPGQLRARLETALDTGTTLVLQPLHDPRPFFAPDGSCWNEIWRFYLGIDDTGKYRAIAGTGVSSRGDWVHGSKNSVSWPLLPPLPSKP